MSNFLGNYSLLCGKLPKIKIYPLLCLFFIQKCFDFTIKTLKFTKTKTLNYVGFNNRNKRQKHQRKD